MLFLFALAGPNDINMAKHRKTVYYKPLILDKNEWLLCPTYIWKDFQETKILTFTRNEEPCMSNEVISFLLVN